MPFTASLVLFNLFNLLLTIGEGKLSEMSFNSFSNIIRVLLGFPSKHIDILYFTPVT